MTGLARAEVRSSRGPSATTARRSTRKGQGTMKLLSGKTAGACATSPASSGSPTRSMRTQHAARAAVQYSVAERTVEVHVDADGDPRAGVWAARRKADLFEELVERKLRFAVDALSERDTPAPRRDVDAPLQGVFPTPPRRGHRRPGTGSGKGPKSVRRPRSTSGEVLQVRAAQERIRTVGSGIAPPCLDRDGVGPSRRSAPARES